MVRRFRTFIAAIISTLLVTAGCSTDSSSGDSDADSSEFSVVITPSRVSGVAPLGVYFDTKATPTFADGSYVDATVLWDFDVDGTDTAGRYRKASGFVAAHVFDTPGIYHVRARVYDARGRIGFADVDIEAQEFSGTTYYVAVNGSDDNDGTSMDAPIATFRHAIADLAGPNTRILFRRGDTFETVYVVPSNPTGPVLLTGYDDPSSPSDQAPVIYSTAQDSDSSTLQLGDDWRVVDMHFRAGGWSQTEPRYPGIFGGGTNTLLYRLELDNFSGSAAGMNSKIMAECNLHDFSRTGWYEAEGGGGAVMGNWVHDMAPDSGQHVLRIQGGAGYFIAFNHFGPRVYNNYEGLTVRGNSSDVVIYHNQLNDWLTGLWPQNRDSAEEYQHHLVVDSNLFVGQEQRGSAVAIRATDTTVRNNIFVNYQSGVSIEDDSVVGPSQRIRVYNNTFINGTPSDYFSAITVDSACRDIDLKNNVMFDDVGAEPSYFRFLRLDGSELDGTSDHNAAWGTWDSVPGNLFPTGSLAGWQATGQDEQTVVQSFSLASTEVSAMSDGSLGRPTEAPPLADSGAPLAGTALDFYGNLRDSATDRGAVEFGTEGQAIPWYGD